MQSQAGQPVPCLNKRPSRQGQGSCTKRKKEKVAGHIVGSQDHTSPNPTSLYVKSTSFLNLLLDNFCSAARISFLVDAGFFFFFFFSPSSFVGDNYKRQLRVRKRKDALPPEDLGKFSFLGLDHLLVFQPVNCYLSFRCKLKAPPSAKRPQPLTHLPEQVRAPLESFQYILELGCIWVTSLVDVLTVLRLDFQVQRLGLLCSLPGREPCARHRVGAP